MRGARLLFGLTAAALVVAAGDGAARAGGDSPRPFRRGPDFQKRVDAAIAKGVAWLKAAQHGDGSYPDVPFQRGGVTALAYHVLRSSHVPVGDASAAGAYRSLQSVYDSMTSPKKQDATGLTVYVASARDLVKYLGELQNEKGMWGYGRYRAIGLGMDPDNSNTQFAVLGLTSASRLGARAPTVVWRRALKHFLDTQTGQGTTGGGSGWSYQDGAHAIDDATTSGGIGAVVMCRSELLGDSSYTQDRDAENALRSAVRQLAKSLDSGAVFDLAAAKSAGWSMYRYYLAYGIERAGALSGLSEFGGHDWFGEGAEFLLAMQGPSGAWPAGPPTGSTNAGGAKTSATDTIVSTCFALLFLGRATPPVARGALTGAMDDSDINFVLAPKLSDKDFADVLDLVLSRWRRVSDAAVKERLFAKTTAVGPRIVAPLVKRLASSKDEDRAAAFALLKRATGLDNGYDPSAKPEMRETAVAAWQTWWLANQKTLRFDAASGRLIP